MVKNPLMRPYFPGRGVALAGVPVNSHEKNMQLIFSKHISSVNEKDIAEKYQKQTTTTAVFKEVSRVYYIGTHTLLPWIVRRISISYVSVLPDLTLETSPIQLC